MASAFEPRVDPRPDDSAWPELVWPPTREVVLVGETVELRPTIPDEDAAELFAALDDDAVWAHVAGRPGTADQFAESLQASIDAGRVPWTVRHAKSVGGLPAGVVVGTTSYLEVSVPDARVEIGSTTYARAVWATSVNPECKLLLLQYAFDIAGVGRVQLKTDIRNERSQRAIDRLGAKFEGVLRRYQRRADGTLRDTVLFAISVEDWPEVRSGLESRLSS